MKLVNLLHCEMFFVSSCRHQHDEQVLDRDFCHVRYWFSVNR